VDTHYDPDPQTGHDELNEIPSGLEVLAGVLRHEGADVSATDMIRLSQTQSIAALVAEYDTIVTLAEGGRWDDVLSRSGLNDIELTQAKGSPAYAALLAQLRDAENRGFEVDTELPMLVTGRPFDDADDVDDVASVLHYRIDRYVAGVGYPGTPASELVAGIFLRPTWITDPDIVLALNDRADAIEQRSRELATLAIERGDEWVQDFGDTPPAGEFHEQWLLEVASGAAYFDRWRIDEPGTIPDDAIVNLEQETQRIRALDAVQRARALVVIEDTPLALVFVPSSDDLLEPRSPNFGLDY
jgi:hypothetical protein